jgi:protein-disulfide isomerase-like protein with CxxC motif
MISRSMSHTILPDSIPLCQGLRYLAGTQAARRRITMTTSWWRSGYVDGRRQGQRDEGLRSATRPGGIERAGVAALVDKGAQRALRVQKDAGGIYGSLGQVGTEGP